MSEQPNGTAPTRILTNKALDEIEAQLDSTVPYYVPSLIAEIRRLRSESSEDTRRVDPYGNVWVLGRRGWRQLGVYDG